MERRDNPTAGDGRPAGLPADPVYLDYNATTPVDARVAEAARPYWDQWFGNPSSDHAYSERPRQAVARTREQVAALIGAAPGEIVFTGSGSEADQLAIRGAVLAGLRAAPDATPRVMTQITEHPAVLASCEALERWHGAKVTRLPVDASGLIDPEARLADLRDRLHARLAAALPGRVKLNGPPSRRLPTTLNISITGLRGHELLATAPGVAASTGAACHSGQHTPSPVLTAMGLDERRALAAIRLSVGRWTTEADIDAAAGHLADAATRLANPGRRKASSVAS
jgi:cysteine sulfinate desulfinase/cysteine desulfurase-like protein